MSPSVFGCWESLVDVLVVICILCWIWGDFDGNESREDTGIGGRSEEIEKGGIRSCWNYLLHSLYRYHAEDNSYDFVIF